MNKVHGYVQEVGSKFRPMIRTVKDGEGKPVLSPGGKPLEFKTREKALEAALHHVCAYCNGKLRSEGERASSVQSEVEKNFGVIVKNGKTVKVERKRAA